MPNYDICTVFTGYFCSQDALTVFVLYLYCICTIFTTGVLSPYHCRVSKLPVRLLIHQSDPIAVRADLSDQAGSCSLHFCYYSNRPTRSQAAIFYMKISCRSESSNISLVVLGSASKRCGSSTLLPTTCHDFISHSTVKDSRLL